MDPNETLRLIRATAKQMRADTDPGVRAAHAEEFAEYVEALDEWLMRGGFLPDAWKSMTASDFPPSYRARMIAAYPVIAQLTADEAHLATPEERDAAFERVLAARHLRRTHEMFLAER